MTFLVCDPIYCDHLTGSGHPEKPKRYNAIDESLSHLALTKLTPREATEKEVMLCHTKEYIETVKVEVAVAKSQDKLCALSTDIGGDTIISTKTYEVALKAVGGVLVGVDAVMNNIAKNVFCIVRPPGHHASSNGGMGYCIFNNVAIGARYAQQKYNIQRVLIVDWDVHHGNGTQEIFEEDPSVFYFSIHQSPLYPGTGEECEKGEGKGLGMTMNIPITKGPDSSKNILDAFRYNLAEATLNFKPNLIMISSGFDAHKLDEYGNLNLLSEDYQKLTYIVKEIAKTHAGGKIVSVLEGGYNLKAIAEASKAHVMALNS